MLSLGGPMLKKNTIQMPGTVIVHYSDQRLVTHQYPIFGPPLKNQYAIQMPGTRLLNSEPFVK